MLVCFTVCAMAALKCLSLLSELTGSHPDEDKAHPSEVELSISQSSRSCLELSGSCKCAILLALLLSLWIVFSLLSPGHLALSLQIVKVPHIFKNNLINYRNMSAEIKKLTPIPKTHYNARCETYPRNPDIKRFPVPDDKVSWKVEYQAYKPVHYTAASVLAKPVWADNEDIRDVKVSPGFNEKDAKIDRTSFHGDYKVEDGYPLNPVGRTGVIGRGLLGRWGPNHAADPIVTRWKKKNGTIEEHPVSKKRILQFVAIKRADSGEWALPGGMVDPGETVNMTLAREFQEEALDILESGPQNANNLQEKVAELFSENGKEGMRSPGEDISLTLKREFGEETMNSIEAEPHIKEKIARQVSELFKHGCKIYCGYVDDPRNTDNAWMETVACNFHDESGDNVGRFELHAGDDAVGVKWTDIDSSLKLYASHSDFIRKTAELLGAHW